MTKVAKLEPAPAPPVNMSDASVVLAMIDKLIANPDVPVERLEQMFGLHQRVQADNARRAYYESFAKLQADLPTVVKNGTAHNTKYARFEDIVSVIRKPLSEHGFSVSFRTSQPNEKSLSVTGVLAHANGHTEETMLVLPIDLTGSKNAVQALGSSSSYGKRYCLLSLLGIATEGADNDGNSVGDTLSDDQINELFELIAETKTNVLQFLNFARVKVQAVPEGIDQIKNALGQIKAKDFDRINAMLLKKRDRT